MAYLTYNELTAKAFTGAVTLNERLATRTYMERIIFLSYRREDREWVADIVRFLKRNGVNVYIDYLDETLEEKTSEEVAQKLRDRIGKSAKFISLATPNSGKSKWMPWELGLGDRIVNYAHVAILPLSNNPNTWDDQEYGKLYGRIEKQINLNFQYTWYVVYPDGRKIELMQWLAN